MSSLLEPIVVGGKLSLRNRVVMGSMTRNRCLDFKPGPTQVEHYSDRSRDGVGLIVNEGTFVDWTGSDWDNSPVMIDESHSDAWRLVTDAVHREGGKIFFQAWHAGRIQHDQMPIMLEKGAVVEAPSAIKAEGGKYRKLPGQPGHTDNIKAIDDPRDIVNKYRRSVELAKRAGFDGVELLAQGGYLPHTFLMSHANKRTDSYGGSVENRCRFVLELVDTMTQVFDNRPELICVKINPTDIYNDSMVSFEEMKQVYTHLITELVKRKVGIINIGRRGAETKSESGDFFGMLDRPEGHLPASYDPVLDFGKLVKFPGSPTLLMANHDYTVEEAAEMVQGGKLDLITFARPFIYNPDVITRIKHGVPFARNDRGNAVHYGPFSSPDENYNDWPCASI